MTDKQPKALSLADWLDEVNAVPHPIHTKSAAAELRRLHELNAELVEALKRMKLEKGFVCDCGIEESTWDLIEAVQEKINDGN